MQQRSQIVLLLGPLSEPQYPGQRCVVVVMQLDCVNFTETQQGVPSAGDRMEHSCNRERLLSS